MGFFKDITVKYLKKNKERTIATIIGLMIGVAMILTVSMLAESSKLVISDVERIGSGSAEAVFKKVDKEKYDRLKENKKFAEVAPYLRIGSANIALEGGIDINKPQEARIYYVDINAIKKTKDIYFSKLKNKDYDIKEGDVFISNNLVNNISQKKDIEEKIIKVRKVENREGLREDIQGEIDKIDKLTITNKFEDNSIDASSIFVIKDFKKENLINRAKTLGFCVTLKNKSTALKTLNQIALENNMIKDEKESINSDIYYNNMLLLPYDVTSNNAINNSLFVVQVFLFAVIGVATILVIYNSFTISIAERRKDYGMLISIGASKKQIRKLVIIEVMIMATLGLLLGFTIGFLGIKLLYFVLNILIEKLIDLQASQGIASNIPLQLKMVFNMSVILTTIVVTYIITYLGILRPARKAAKTSPIESIKGIDEVVYKKRNVKTSKLSKKILGIEGDLANKSLKRSRGRYRITIVSLTVSIVLFLIVQNTLTIGNVEVDNISPDMFKDADYIVGAYIGENVNKMIQGNENISKEEVKKEIVKQGNSLADNDTRKDLNILNLFENDNTVYLKYDNFNVKSKEQKEYIDGIKEEKAKVVDNTEFENEKEKKRAEEIKQKEQKDLEDIFKTKIIGAEGKLLDEYLKKNGIAELKNGEAIVVGNFVKRTGENYYSTKILDDRIKEDNLTLYSGFDRVVKEESNKEETNNGSNGKIVKEKDEFSKLKIKKIVYDQEFPKVKNTSFEDRLGAIIVNKETFFDIYNDLETKKKENNEKYKEELANVHKNDILESAKENNYSGEEVEELLKTAGHEYDISSINVNKLYSYKGLSREEKQKADKELIELAERFAKEGRENNKISMYVSNDNIAAVFAAIRAVTTIIKILIYGFITLIILISISNVFNTISTNIILRQREFANLKSIGMTKKQMRKMLDFESILYGSKVIIYGILVSYLLMKLLKYMLRANATVDVSISLKSIIYVVIGVLVIIFTTMRYARSKIDDMNIIDVIKKGSM